MELCRVMHRPVQTVAPETLLWQVHALMQQHLHHIAVLRDGVPVGVISEAALWRATPSSLPALARYEWTPALERLQVQASCRDTCGPCRCMLLYDRQRSCWLQRQQSVVLVFDAESLVGLVTLDDLLAALLLQLEAQEPVRYEQIVVCTNDRTTSPAVLRTAFALARQHKARLAVLQVLPSLGTAMPIDLEHVSVGGTRVCTSRFATYEVQR